MKGTALLRLSVREWIARERIQECSVNPTEKEA